MISSLLWVRKGAAQELPDRYKLTDEEYSKVAEKIGAQLDVARDDLADAETHANDMKVDNDAEESMDTEAPAPENGDDELAKYNLDNYDDSDEEETAAAEGPTSIPLFSKVQGLTYHASNEEDPYVQVADQEDEDEELHEMQVLPEDNLLLAAKTEDEISHLEIYVYEEAEDNLYVHHDIMLPSFPLCLEWMNYRVGRKKDVATPGNYVAIGTFDPEVEIWDLDMIDAVYPECILGGINQPGAQAADAVTGGKKKKKKFGPARRAGGINPDRHVDAVMCISWNKTHRNLVATGSADTTVKLWDLNNPEKAVKSFTHHKDKVQAVAWNPSEPTVLLTGGYDKRVCAFDSRAPDSIAEWKLAADVECLLWDPFHPERFFVSTEDGLVQCFDATKSGSAPIFTLHAHDAAVSALDVSALVEGLMVTASTDKMVKIWNIKDNKPSCIVSRDLDLGKVFSANFSPDSPYAVCAAGSKGKVLVWNLEDNAGVRRAFPVHQHNVAATAEKPKKKEITGVESDSEEEEEEEETGIEGAMDVDDEDDSEEEHV
ncbi:WD40-repeat-containing domain protein [Gaertneriomyces semiglobifer]|nr:WD40-repeat-containing domain protein [Gaertneriomyces semiglobifer]